MVHQFGGGFAKPIAARIARRPSRPCPHGTAYLGRRAFRSVTDQIDVDGC